MRFGSVRVEDVRRLVPAEPWEEPGKKVNESGPGQDKIAEQINYLVNTQLSAAASEKWIAH